MKHNNALHPFEEARPNRGPDPFRLIIGLALLLVAIGFAVVLSSCNVVKETITAPDGTVTQRESKTLDAAAVTAGANAITAFAPPRPHIVREEKSGPITAEEIRKRFRTRKIADAPPAP